MTNLFNEAIKVIRTNLEMHVEVFQNSLRVVHFSYSLDQKLVLTMTEIMAQDESYIKGEKINAEKKSMDVKENSFDKSDSL